MPKIATGIAAVALAAVVALAVITISTNDSLNAERARNQAIAAVLAAPDARIVSGPTSAGGTATVVASHRAGQIVFTSSGLRVLPSSQVYELWFLGPGTARSVFSSPGGKIVFTSSGLRVLPPCPGVRAVVPRAWQGPGCRAGAARRGHRVHRPGAGVRAGDPATASASPSSLRAGRRRPRLRRSWCWRCRRDQPRPGRDPECGHSRLASNSRERHAPRPPDSGRS